MASQLLQSQLQEKSVCETHQREEIVACIITCAKTNNGKSLEFRRARLQTSEKENNENSVALQTSEKENNENSVALSCFEILKHWHCSTGFPPYCQSSRLKPRSARNFCKQTCPSLSYDQHVSTMFDWSSHSHAPFAGERRFSKARGLSASVSFLPLHHPLLLILALTPTSRVQNTILVPFLGLSLLPNPTETLAMQATMKYNYVLFDRLYHGLPSRRVVQSGLKLWCVYENLMANNFFQNWILHNLWIERLKYYSRFSSVVWSKLKIITIQWKKPRICDTIDDWCINNHAKNQVPAVFDSRVVK